MKILPGCEGRRMSKLGAEMTSDNYLQGIFDAVEDVIRVLDGSADRQRQQGHAGDLR